MVYYRCRCQEFLWRYMDAFNWVTGEPECPAPPNEDVWVHWPECRTFEIIYPSTDIHVLVGGPA